MVRKGDEIDLKGLINDAYAIEGITEGECRTIFLDWALAVPAGADVPAMIRVLLERHGLEGHPMTAVLQEGLEKAAQTGRRGGRRGRLSS